MPDLLVAVVELTGEQVLAWLAEVDRPGAVLREAADLRKTRHGKHVAIKAHAISRALAAKQQQQLAGAGLKQAAGFA